MFFYLFIYFLNKLFSSWHFIIQLIIFARGEFVDNMQVTPQNRSSVCRRVHNKWFLQASGSLSTCAQEQEDLHGEELVVG